MKYPARYLNSPPPSRSWPCAVARHRERQAEYRAGRHEGLILGYCWCAAMVALSLIVTALLTGCTSPDPGTMQKAAAVDTRPLSRHLDDATRANLTAKEKAAELRRMININDDLLDSMP